jgi:ketosteroid isomerase-like protein
MKPRFVIVMLVILALAIPATMLAQQSKAEQEVRAALEEFRQANLKGGAEGAAILDKYLSDDFTMILGNGAAFSKPEVLDCWRSGRCKSESYDLSDVKIRLYGKTAVVTGILKHKGESVGGGAQGAAARSARVLVKRGGVWQSVLLQNTRIAEPAKVEIADLPSASGGTQHVWYAAPANPWAVAIVFVGGDGELPFEADGSLKGGRSIFVRTRQLWLDQGIAVLIAGKPSSLKGIWMYRLTDAYAQDIQTLVEFARARTPVPIWLFGHSLGTNAVASGASRLTGGQIAGVVFASATTQHAPSKEIVFDVPLLAINVPALVIAHEHDACPNSPPDGGSRLRAALTGSPASDLVFFSGGEPSGGPCDPTALHTFVGLDQEVVARVATWMRRNTLRIKALSRNL